MTLIFLIQVLAWCGLATVCNFAGNVLGDNLDAVPPFDQFD